MKRVLMLTLAALLSTTLIGCESSSKNDSSKSTAESADKEASSESGDKQASSDDGQVDVPTDGKEFDPAVEKQQLPEGAWICDMDTVHFAAMEKPEDGKCPVCGMPLEQNAPSEEKSE